jgi:hypothetical protein
MVLCRIGRDLMNPKQVAALVELLGDENRDVVEAARGKLDQLGAAAARRSNPTILASGFARGPSSGRSARKSELAFSPRTSGRPTSSSRKRW